MVDSISSGTPPQNITNIQRINADEKRTEKAANPQDQINISTQAQEQVNAEQSARDIRSALEEQGSVVLSGDGARLKALV